jgi:hypothetical protein
MIWRAVPASVSVPEAEALAQHFATQPTETFGLLKQALTASTTNDLSTQLDLSATFSERLLRLEISLRACVRYSRSVCLHIPGVMVDADTLPSAGRSNVGLLKRLSLATRTMATA